MIKSIKEIFDPVTDFYSMRHKHRIEIILFIVCPIVIAGVFLVADHFLLATRSFDLDTFISDMINQLITVLALFVSFSLAYLSIITTSSSNNVDGLKNSLSSVYILKGAKEYCSLYQVLVSEITYTLFVDIIFLFLVFIEKFIIYISNDQFIKCMIAINIALLTHVLILMAVSIKNIYFSFWRSE